MTTGPLIVIGAGGHAKVVIDVLRAWRSDAEIAGLVDRDLAARPVNGVPVIGNDASLPELRSQGIRQAVVALGDNALRFKIGAQLRELGFQLLSPVSPAACLSSTARIGAGVVVMPGAVINADAEVSDLAIVNSGAVVEHDCRVGAAAHLAPRTAAAGGVAIGQRTLIGVGASIIPGISIGDDVVVGGGACVVSDLPSGVLALGVPARIIQISRSR